MRCPVGKGPSWALNLSRLWLGARSDLCSLGRTVRPPRTVLGGALAQELLLPWVNATIDPECDPGQSGLGSPHQASASSQLRAQSQGPPHLLAGL